MNNYKNLILKKINLKDFSSEKLKIELEKIKINDIFNFYKELENEFDKFKSSDFNLSRIIKLLNNNCSFSWKFADQINKSEKIKTMLDEDSNHFIKDLNILKSSIEGVFESGYYDSKFSELGVCWFRLIENHPFSNGNKRTAFISIKINIIVDIISGILNDNLKELENEFDSKLKKFSKENHKIKNKKNISKNKIHQIKENYWKKMNNLIKKEFSKFLKNLIIDISDIWIKKTSLSEDYILSVWIVSNINSLNYDQFKDKIFEILKINLIFFVLINFNKIKFEISNFEKDFSKLYSEEIENFLKKQIKEFK